MEGSEQVAIVFPYGITSWWLYSCAGVCSSPSQPQKVGTWDKDDRCWDFLYSLFLSSCGAYILVPICTPKPFEITVHPTKLLGFPPFMMMCQLSGLYLRCVYFFVSLKSCKLVARHQRSRSSRRSRRLDAQPGGGGRGGGGVGCVWFRFAAESWALLAWELGIFRA